MFMCGWEGGRDVWSAVDAGCVLVGQGHERVGGDTLIFGRYYNKCVRALDKASPNGVAAVINASCTQYTKSFCT